MLVGILMLGLGAPPILDAEPLLSRVPEARKDALARFGAGLWQVHRERLLTAIRSLEAAAKQDPDSTAALKELVAVYSKVGREPEAIRAARIVMEKDPHDADTAHALSRLLVDSGELAEALTFAKLAAEHVDASVRPEKALAVYRDLATIQDRTGNAAGAVAAQKLALELLTTKRKAIIALAAFTPSEVDEEAALTYERLGKALVKSGTAGAAAEAFREAHKLYSDTKRLNDSSAAARLDWNLSSAFAEKDPAVALRHLESFLKLQPQAVEPYERLVSLLNRTNRVGEVVPLLQKYAAREPKNQSLQAVLACEMSRDVAARPTADAAFTALLAATNDPKILRLIIRSHIETDRAVRAIEMLDIAYLLLKDDGAKMDAARTFAAERTRGVFEVLANETEWSAAVHRAAANDLRNGTKRTYQTWHALGVLAARQNRLDFAEVQFEEAVRLAPIDSQGDAYTQWIHVLRLIRKPEKIESVCREGLRSTMIFPAFFNYHLALALADLGKADEAVLTADKAIAQAGAADRLAIRLQKVSVLRRVDRWDDAIAMCKKLLGEFEDPVDRIRIRYVLASSYSGAKKLAESEAELRGILDVEPDHTGACNDLGYHLAEQGRNLDEAERLVRRAVSVDRADRRKSGDPELDNSAYLDSLAWVLFRRERLTEARELLEKVATMPNGIIDGVVWDHLGDVRFRLGEKEKAKSAWESAAKLLATEARGKRDGRLEDVKRKLKRLP